MSIRSCLLVAGTALVTLILSSSLRALFSTYPRWRNPIDLIHSQREPAGSPGTNPPSSGGPREAHMVQVHREKDINRVVPSKLYICGCCFCLFVVVVVVSHVVQMHPEKDLSRVVPSKLYVCRCYFVCLWLFCCVSHVVQVHPEKDLNRVVHSKLYVSRCYFVCL